MIEVENLTKYYGNVMAIEDLNFLVERGEVLGFLGPNAAGKTTTMRILTGYIPPTSGMARVAGYDVFRDSLEVRRRIGYLPETVPLYPDMTPWSYLNYVAKLRDVPNREDRVEEVMGICNVTQRADDLIGRLSKGYRQRVGLAQALVHDPDVLILDEPTIGLDPRQIIKVRELIRQLGADHTIILSTHVLLEVSQTCQRVIIINGGRLVAMDTPERLTSRLKGAERIYLELADPAPDVTTYLLNIPGVTAVEESALGAFEVECAIGEDLRPTIAAAVVEQGWGLLEMRSLGMSLEEIFMQLTTE